MQVRTPQLSHHGYGYMMMTKTMVMMTTTTTMMMMTVFVDVTFFSWPMHGYCGECGN